MWCSIATNSCTGDSCEACERNIFQKAPNDPLRVECSLQEVIVHRERRAPLMDWILGHQHLLYAELSASALELDVRQTEPAILLREGQAGKQWEEVWSWEQDERADKHLDYDNFPAALRMFLPNPSEHVHKQNRDPSEIDKANFFFDVPGENAEFTLRVYRSFMTLHLALSLQAPVELLGEARFRIEQTGPRSEFNLPLSKNGEACGYILFSVSANPISVRNPPVLGDAVPVWQKDDVREYRTSLW